MKGNPLHLTCIENISFEGL